MAYTDDEWDAMCDLLTLIAISDRRTTGDEDVAHWLDCAIDGGWPSIEFARRAVVRHRNNRPGVWLEPGHITQQWRTLRTEALTDFNEPEPSRDVLDDGARYVAWCREQQAAHVARHVAAWLADQASPAHRRALQR